MVELTPEQQQAVDASRQPAVVVDPRTGQEYLLIRRDVYEKVRSVLAPFGRAWDNPADDDLIRRGYTAGRGMPEGGADGCVEGH